MGKGTIVSGGTDGLYQIDYNVDKTRMQAQIDAIVSEIEVLTKVEIPELEADVAEKQTAYSNLLVKLNSAIQLHNDTTEITKELSIALSALTAAQTSLASGKIRLASITQGKKFLTDNLPPDEEIAAWCADLNEGLTGDVGMIEVPGERTEPVIIRPGGESGNDAVYNADVDGLVVPVLGQSPSEACYNLFMLPGWQKYQPTYRLGVITNLNGNLCDITLDPAVSSQQGLDVNPSPTLTGVPITYLTCDGAAFEANDRVVIKYTGTGPGTTYTPSVIGFESNPKVCSTIDFTADVVIGPAPLTVNFTSIAKGYNPLNYLWSYGGLEYDGVNSSFSEVTHTYDSPGVYAVKLKAWDGDGVSATVPRSAGDYHTRTGSNLPTNLAAYNDFLSTSEVSSSGDSAGWYRIDTGISTFEYSNRRVFKTPIMNVLSADNVVVAFIQVRPFIVNMEGIPVLKESGVSIGRVPASRLSQISQVAISDISDYIGTDTEMELTDESFLQLTSPVSQGDEHGWNSDLKLTRYPKGQYAEKTKTGYITVL